MGFFDGIELANPFLKYGGDALSSVAESGAAESGDWVDDLFSSEGISGLLKGAGQLSGLFTSSAEQKRAQTPQFATRPMNLQLEDLTALRNWIDSNTNPVTIPTRQLTEAEKTDPIFAPQAVQYLEKYFADQGQPAATEATTAPAPAPVDDVMMRGMMEAQRRASAPSTTKGMTAEQLRQYMQDARSGMAPSQAQALLNPGSEGYTNEYTGAELNREEVIRKLGALNLAGDPLNLSYSDNSNEAIQSRMAERDKAREEMRTLMAGINYTPPKNSLGRLIGGTLLPMAATAAFGAGLPSGLPFTGSQLSKGVNTVRRMG